MCVYSRLLMRFSWMVQPRNYLLLSCHASNETVQLYQLSRWVSVHGYACIFFSKSIWGWFWPSCLKAELFREVCQDDIGLCNFSGTSIYFSIVRQVYFLWLLFKLRIKVLHLQHFLSWRVAKQRLCTYTFFSHMCVQYLDTLSKIRPLWRHYFQNTQGLIFLVDSNDRDRVAEERDELHKMLNKDELRDAVLLVFSNKQYLPNAMTAAEITDKLALHSLRQPHCCLRQALS